MSRPKVIDLYSGVGGLSLGAERAGFDVVSAVEIDKHAVQSHKKNFPETRCINEDLSTINGEMLLSLSGLSSDEVDGIIGGPPCQGFSNMGKQRVDDTRNNLFVHFFQLISEINPSFFLAENVPGILNSKYDSLRQAAFSLVEEKYNLLPPIKLKASDFGAPTIRTRVFFVGFLKKMQSDHLQKIRLHKAPNVRIAFSGLPQTLTAGENTWVVKVPQDILKQHQHYFTRITGDIPATMSEAEGVKNYVESSLVTGFNVTNHTAKVAERFSTLKAGENDKVSRASRLDPSGYAPTLRAGTGPDHGSFQAVRPIHYSQPRVITPREAARIQGFPDWFTFDKTIWHSFRQIGNSVSPFVAEAILTSIHQMLTF